MDHRFVVQAGNSSFLPARLSVHPGDRVTIELASSDVVHGLRIDGYDVEVAADPGQPASLSFVADRPGTFRIRCSITCGPLHPFMVAELAVGYDVSFARTAGIVALAAAAGLAAGRRASGRGSARLDLLRSPLVRSILKSRWPQWIVSIALLGGFLLAVGAGLAGTSVGNRNFATVGVWILWWAVLIWVAIPLLGRGWCSVCPLPLPAEWLQRRSVLGPGSAGPLGWNLRWPRRLRTLWPSIGLFSLLAVFSVPILTQPRVTALVLLALALAAVAVGLVFERRTFCRFLCPIGGFVGLYAQVAPLGLRPMNASLCASCREKPCYRGGANGYGCPWLVFPGALNRNVNCGLCLECLRTCPSENLAIHVRGPGEELMVPAGNWDEAFKTLAMLAAAIAYAAVLFGLGGAIKAAASQPGTGAWFAYAAALLGFLFLFVPGGFALAVGASRRLSRSRAPFRGTFTALSRALVPVGLTSWVAFCLAFVPPNLPSVGLVLGDPFGWGWSLLGLGAGWDPGLLGGAGLLQAAVLGIGVFSTARVACELSARFRLTPVPVVAFAVAAALALQWQLG
jgi:polyferredoxin/plastocyanin